MFKILFLLLFAGASSVWAAAQASPPRLPLVFEPNQGQAPAQAKWIAHGPGYQLFFTDAGVTMQIPRENSAQTNGQPISTAKLNATASRAYNTIQMKLKGSHTWKNAAGLQPTGGVSNYLIGKDPSKWHTGVPHFAKISETSVYDDVDLVFYSNGLDLEYDFVVKPGADPKQIQMAFEGTERVSVDDKSGDLLLTTAGGAQVRQVRPKVYQQIGDKRVAVAAGYELLDRGRASFTLAAYDHRQPLIIDPILTYQVYLGGSNGDYISAIAHNEDGHTFVTGATASTDFPNVNGILPSPRKNNAFVAHLDVTGFLVSSTYLGGSEDDSGIGIAVDDTGIYVTGQTKSPDFPHQMSKTSSLNSDTFVTKMALDGGSILYTTILSGAGFTNASGIAVNPATHNVYISGSTNASNFPNIYPLNSGWHQVRYGGGAMDAFAVQLDSAGDLYRSNLLGGNDIDVAQGIAVDQDGNPWVTGLTCSPDFINQYTPAQTKAPGCVGFVASWTNDFALLRFSRFWELGTAVTTDRFGNGYVAGVASGTYAGIGGTTQDAPLVTKFNQRGDLLNYRSITGANGWSTASSIALNSLGEVYLGGYTLATSFPGLPRLPGNPMTGILAILSADFKDVRYTGMFGHQVTGITVLDSLPRRLYPLVYLAASISGSHGADGYTAQMVDDPRPYQQYEGKLLEDSRGERSFIVAGQRKLVPDEDTRNALGLGSFPLVSIDSVGAIPDAGSYPPLQPGKTLRDAANNRVYQLSEGVLHWIPDSGTFEKMGLSWNDVVTLPRETLNRIPEGLKLPPL